MNRQTFCWLMDMLMLVLVFAAVGLPAALIVVVEKVTIR